MKLVINGAHGFTTEEVKFLEPFTNKEELTLVDIAKLANLSFGVVLIKWDEETGEIIIDHPYSY